MFLFKNEPKRSFLPCYSNCITMDKSHKLSRPQMTYFERVETILDHLSF